MDANDPNFVEQYAPSPQGPTGLDYSNPGGSGYNDYPGATAGIQDRPAYATPGADGSGAVSGAAAGSAAGPWGAVIGAVAGLLMQQKQQQAADRANKLSQQEKERDRALNNVQNYQHQQIATAGNMGTREQNAIGQLIGVFNAARR